MLLMADPHNFRRSWFHARDYGVLVANPFGQQRLYQGTRKASVTVRPGETLRLRFGVLVHQGDTDLAAEYQHWIASDRRE